MKILHLIASTGIGGAEKHLLDLCLQQQASGLQVCVALPATGALSLALQNHGIAYNLIRKGSRWDPLALWSLRQVIQREQPDLVHAHMPKSASMVGYAYPAMPCVVTAHNIVKHLGPFRRCRHVICVSEKVRDSLCQLGYPERMASVIYNAVNTQVFHTVHRNQLRLKFGWQEQLIVLCVARLVPAKGQQFAIEALAQLAARFTNLHLVLVGAGPDRDKLIRLASKLGVTAQLSLLGERSDVPELLAASDIYLQPSLKEGFCIAFLEAMATGLVCIGTNTGAIPNMLETGVNGLLIEPGNTHAIADALFLLATDTEQSASFKVAAKTTAETKFSLKKQVNDTLMIYLQVLNLIS